MALKVWVRTSLRLTFLVGLVSAIAVVGLMICYRVFDMEDLRSSSDSLGTYTQTVGGIYAVLLAFVTVVVWGQFNDARGFVNREANAVVDLYRIAGALPDALCDTVREGLRDYLNGVLGDEWEAMSREDEPAIDKIGQRLDRVWNAIHRYMPQNESQAVIYGEVLSRFNDLTELRTSRVTAATAKIPIAMNVLLYTGAIILIAAIYFLPFDHFWLHAVVAGAFAGALAHILFLIYDLDDAFAGDYQVDRGPFVRAQKAIGRVDVAKAAIAHAAAASAEPTTATVDEHPG